MNNDNEFAEFDRPSFDAVEERWFADAAPRRESRRPSQRPASIAPRIDDSIADGWFCDV